MLKNLLIFFVIFNGTFGLSWIYDKMQRYENTRIVGGRQMDIKSAPFIVLLVADGRPLCGASIISSSFFLTASHCTDGSSPQDITIRSGSNRIGAGELQVSEIHQHPNYDSSNFDYDLSILKSNTRMAYDETRRAISLPSEDDVTPPGEFVRVLGWGNTMNPLESTEYLREVDLVVIDDRECEAMYEKYNIDVETNKVCAVHPERIDGKDACQGDSGGPLQRIIDGKLIGVVSFGLGCAKAEYAGIYSRVSASRGWIKNITGV